LISSQIQRYDRGTQALVNHLLIGGIYNQSTG